MDTTPGSAPASGWCTMAMVEVDGAARALDEILAGVSSNCRLNPAPSPRIDKPRFYIIADASRGQAHALRSVGLLLFALDAIAQSGELAGFRVIAAEPRLRDDASRRFAAWSAREVPRPAARA